MDGLTGTPENVSFSTLDSTDVILIPAVTHTSSMGDGNGAAMLPVHDSLSFLDEGAIAHSD